MIRQVNSNPYIRKTMSKNSTEHRIIIGQAQQMKDIKDNSIHLVVTSPPYPMIEMWDGILARQNPDIQQALDQRDGRGAFEIMHRELDKVWAEVNRVLVPGGFACINIGDAARTIHDEFALYSNHARIISSCTSIGLTNLPNILWRKQTNAPNKFMGSGMLPAGAYVTLEHEWILIFRKGGKRIFHSDVEKQLRKESAFFWEERNSWFSDLWDLKGVKQKLQHEAARERSAAFPFEIPYRLVNMYSVKGDTVLDPFLGTGTTSLAAIAGRRNSIGIEMDPSFAAVIEKNIMQVALSDLHQLLQSRIDQHKKFLTEQKNAGSKKAEKHLNKHLDMPVVTSQETEMVFSFVDRIRKTAENIFTANYRDISFKASIHPEKDSGSNSTEIPLLSLL